MAIAQSPDFDAITDSWAVLILMRGAMELLERDALARWPSELPIEIELHGDRQVTWYGAVLVTPHPGVVLFRELADAKACAALAGDEQQAYIAARDHLRVQLETGPEYVIAWIHDFFEMERMPRVLKREGGAKVLALDEDALVIGGVLSALALVEDVRETAYSHTRTTNREVRTFVSPATPWPALHLPG